MIVGVRDLLDDPGRDLDPLTETSFVHCASGTLDVPVERVEADSSTVVGLHEPDQIARISASDVEDPTVPPKGRAGQLQQHVGAPRIQALIKSLVQRVVRAIDASQMTEVIRALRAFAAPHLSRLCDLDFERATIIVRREPGHRAENTTNVVWLEWAADDSRVKRGVLGAVAPRASYRP